MLGIALKGVVAYVVFHNRWIKIMQLSTRSQTIQPSATLAITQLANTLISQGNDIISLSLGEPDFPTPEHIKEAAFQAIRENHTHYTAVDGIKPLKEAIVKKFARENNLTYSMDQILVSVGSKHSFYNLSQALLDDGDEVIIPAPYWVSYPDIIKLAGATPVFIEADIHQGFKITASQLEAAITKKTRMFVLNTPSNPTGAEYTHPELCALGDVLKKHPNIIIAADEIYEHLRWSKQPFVSILNACPELANQTMILNGVSKAYAMTGWRIGYAAGPATLIKNMNKIQSQITSNPCSISQYAAIAALNGGLDCIKPMQQAFHARHDKVVAALNNTPGFNCIPVEAALYVFANVEDAMKRLGITSDAKFTEFLIEKAGVALVPGSAFGIEGYVRFSIAASEAELDEAMKRINAVMI